MASQTAPAIPLVNLVQASPKALQASVKGATNASTFLTQSVEVADRVQRSTSAVPVLSPTGSATTKAGRSQTPVETPMTAEAIHLETYLHQTLDICNKLAKTDFNDPALTGPEPQGSALALGSEVAAAKMLNYCIRMLHADGWHPPTVIRAMVLRECGLEAGMKTTLYKALRERREEIKVGEAKRTGLANEAVEAVVGKGMKKSASSSKHSGRKGTPGKGRTGRAVTASGADAAAAAVSVDVKGMVADGGAEHRVEVQGHQNGPFMSLI